jgi:hypothetical protein
MATNIGVVEIDWDSRVGISIKIHIGVLSSQSANNNAIVLNDAVDRLPKGSQLSSGCLYDAIFSNRGTTKKRDDALIGVICLENGAGIGSSLIIGKSNSDCIRLAGLERRSRDNNGQKRKDRSEGELHFEIEEQDLQSSVKYD